MRSSCAAAAGTKNRSNNFRKPTVAPPFPRLLREGGQHGPQPRKLKKRRSSGIPTLLTLFLLALFTRRVPHPFAICAKGWAARTSTQKAKKRAKFRDSHPCKERKDGAPSVVVISRCYPKGGPPAVTRAILGGSLGHLDVLIPVLMVAGAVLAILRPVVIVRWAKRAHPDLPEDDERVLWIGGWPTLLSFLFALFTQRVPHPFAFCAKGWAAPTSTQKAKKRAKFRDSHPCKERKDGAPSVVVMSAKTQGWATRRRKIVASRKEYNEERPHSGLRYGTPNELAEGRRRASVPVFRRIFPNVWSAHGSVPCVVGKEW